MVFLSSSNTTTFLFLVTYSLVVFTFCSRCEMCSPQTFSCNLQWDHTAVAMTDHRVWSTFHFFDVPSAFCDKQSSRPTSVLCLYCKTGIAIGPIFLVMPLCYVFFSLFLPVLGMCFPEAFCKFVYCVFQKLSASLCTVFQKLSVSLCNVFSRNFLSVCVLCFPETLSVCVLFSRNFLRVCIISFPETFWLSKHLVVKSSTLITGSLGFRSWLSHITKWCSGDFHARWNIQFSGDLR